jgi:cation:H+ antiporter
MVIGAILLIGGIALVLWGGDRFTDGSLRAAAAFSMSLFYVGAVVSGFEPENLVTGVAAAVEGLDQVALGTVIGSSVFMLTAGLGLTLLIVPMEVRIPPEGPLAMLVSLVLFVAVLRDGIVGRLEGGLLVLVAVGLMAWLHRSSPVFQRAPHEDHESPESATRGSPAMAVGLLIAGIAVMLLGAELMVRGVQLLLGAVRLCETFLGMAVVGMGESVEETAPGRPEGSPLPSSSGPTPARAPECDRRPHGAGWPAPRPHWRPRPSSRRPRSAASSSGSHWAGCPVPD